MTASKVSEHRAARRKWSLGEERRIVELTLGAGISTHAIALEHGVYPTNLSHWKALYRAGKLDEQRMKQLPRPRVLHPWSNQRFAVKHPRWEPGA